MSGDLINQSVLALQAPTDDDPSITFVTYDQMTSDYLINIIYIDVLQNMLLKQVDTTQLIWQKHSFSRLMTVVILS